MIVSRNKLMGELKATYQTLWQIASTVYGPRSSNVLIQRSSGCFFSNDGSIVLRELRSKHRVRAVIEDIIRQAALKTSQECGDGATTTLILTLVLLREGFKAIEAGVSIPKLQNQIKEALDKVCYCLSDLSRPVEECELRQLALISSRGDQDLSEHIVNALLEIGEDGFIAIEESKGVGVETKYTSGIRIPIVPCSYAFLSGEPKKVLEGCLVATLQTPMTSFEQIKSLLECASQWEKNPLLIFSTSFVTGQALETILLNNAKSRSNCIAVHITENPDMRRESLRDIAALSGSSVIDKIQGKDLREFKSEWFGTLRQATLTRSTLTAVPYDEEAGGLSWVDDRIHELESRSITAEGYIREDLKRRIAQLSDGLCTIEVGSITDSERKVRLSKAEKVVKILNCTLANGVVIGGGNTLAYCSLNMDTSKLGESIVSKALQTPIQILYGEAGKSLDLDQIDPIEGMGFDCLEHRYRNVLKPPQVITPSKLLRDAVVNAVSVASTLLLSEMVVLK